MLEYSSLNNNFAQESLAKISESLFEMPQTILIGAFFYEQS